MSKKKPKTEGLEWLIHSLNAFNGSGYADMNSPEDFLESYVAYKVMRDKPEAVVLAQRFKQDALLFLDDFLQKTYGASRKPAEKHLKRLQATRDQLNSQMKFI
jgi:hypothetical protein